MILAGIIALQIAVSYAIFTFENASMMTMMLLTLFLYSVVLKKDAAIEPKKAKMVDDAELSFHFGYIRQLLRDIKTHGVDSAKSSNSEETVSQIKDVMQLVVETVLEKSLDVITKKVNAVMETHTKEIQTSRDRHAELAASIEHLGKTVALSAFRTQEVTERLDDESEKSAARARVLQESIFSTFVLQRQEVCAVDVQTLRQLRICLETLMTPVELLLKHQDPNFEPRSIDSKRWQEIEELEKKAEEFNSRNNDEEGLGEIPEDLVDLNLVGIEAVIVDEDGIVACCPSVCSAECRQNTISLLSDPATQAVRAQVPGSLQYQRMNFDIPTVHEEDQKEEDGTSTSEKKQPQLSSLKREPLDVRSAVTEVKPSLSQINSSRQQSPLQRKSASSSPLCGPISMTGSPRQTVLVEKEQQQMESDMWAMNGMNAKENNLHNEGDAQQDDPWGSFV
eukprot:GDKJ01056586.1.p1 GENE.GDKJ01056586.1~~GDKJ01056586.1.p1  ORF type:complete len:460 (-),score=115.54 GDKJ01056586.1:157-1509(-)